MISSESELHMPLAQAPGVLARTLTRWLMRPAQIGAVETLSRRFRFIDFEGPALRNCAWAPGQKIQISFDGGLLTRTYTPVRWDPASGATRILAYAHGAGPGSDWVRAVAQGTRCQLFGPRRSTDLENLPGTTVLFGDETSFGLAMALQARLNGRHEVRTVFEVTSLAESCPVLTAAGLDADVVERRPDEAHLSEIKRITESLLGDTALFILSGKAQSVQFVSRILKARGVPPGRIRAKAYWAPGKKGLD